MDTQQIRSRLQERKQILIAKEKALEQELDEALSRLDKGQYGICENCKRPIEPSRLESLPEVRTCAECEQESQSQANPGAQAVS